MIAHLILTLFALFATWADNPAPVDTPPIAHHAPHAATVGDAPTTPHYAPPPADRAAAEPAEQLSEELLGSYRCEDPRAVVVSLDPWRCARP